MKLTTSEKFIGSGFFSGYIPKASGTFSSLVAIPFIFLGNEILLILIITSLILGKKIAEKFESVYGKDPKNFTLDEFIGTWVSFLYVNVSLSSIIVIFLLWRIFDILKPFPINRLELINGGWGIILDDVLAGVFANIVGQIIIYFVINK